MAYPEKILADDEKVVEHLHPHWITLVPATLWFIVICAAGGFGIGEIYSQMDKGTTRTVLVIVIVVVALALLVYTTFRPWIGWRTTHYVMTTHRVLIRRGVFNHVGRDISLQRINDVAFNLTLWDRLVGAGTLVIESAGEHGQEALKNVPHCEQVQQSLNRLIEQDGDRRAQRGYGGGYQQGPPPQGYQQPGYQQGPPQQGGQYPPTQQYPPQN